MFDDDVTSSLDLSGGAMDGENLASQKAESSVYASEWILVGSLALLFISLFVIATIRDGHKNFQIKNCLEDKVEPIEIDIRGAVLKPGRYSFLPGVRLKEVLKKSIPKKHADLRLFDLNKQIGESLEIVVTELSSISIRVEGAVMCPVDLMLPPGTRLCGIKSKIQLEEDADTNFLKKRRILKDGELILIPRRSVKEIM